VSSLFVDVWHGNILLKQSEEGYYWSLLNEGEKQKADTFTRSELQKKYVKTRGVLREILAPYLDIEPKCIDIKTGDYGKPYLANNLVNFNLSHTGNKFVLAVGNVGEMGIDLEQARDRMNMSGLVKKCFSDEESVYWHSLPEIQKTDMFFRFWVRKEAFVKAVGRGIALGLEHCNVDLESQAYFLNIPEDYGLASDWRIWDIQLKQEDVCALVTKNLEFDYKKTELK
jgi:4'-phosphopantetheinyl transferase